MSNSKNLAVRLSDFASQENCDGEPYDTMQAASDYIRELEARLAAAEADAERLDWLDRNLQMKNGWRVGVAKAGNIVVTSVGLSETSIRAAIDAARGGDDE